MGAAASTLVAAAAQAQERPPPPSPPASQPAQRVLGLADVERTALQVQPLLRAARASISVAEAQAEQARSPLLPQVIGSAAYTRETGNFAPRPGVVAGSPGGSLFSTSYDYFQFGVTATQLIYDFGQTSQRYDAAKLIQSVSGKVGLW